MTALDVAMMVVGVHLTNTDSKTRLAALLLGTGLTLKSFLKAAKWSSVGAFWIATNIIEMALKTIVARWLASECRQDFIAVVGAVVCATWAVYAGIRPADRNTSEPEKKPAIADIAFLGHPAELHDCWALWLLPYSLDSRWRRPWWSVPLWPFHYLVGYYSCNWRRQLFGNGASFFNCDNVVYEGVRMQTWTAAHFGRHFFTSKRAVQHNIEATAKYADETGVKVLCLGALNKAESINAGGVGVVRALGATRKLSVIHGNHLTAAAVVETTHQCFGDKAKVFLTGASSKVGWAVAQALKDRYDYEILCHSTDESRRTLFKERGFAAASTLEEGTSFSNLWVVGKYDKAVADTIPQGATAVVFAVPHPLHCRKDVRVIEAGNLHIDLFRFNRPRRFTNKLAAHEIFACHAAGVVAAHRLKQGRTDENGRVDEIGPVDPEVMDSWLDDAKNLGFRVPVARPVDAAATHPHDMATFLSTGSAPAVVVGAGPSGLAVAAALRRKGIQSIILDEQKQPDSFGSWDKHFTGLEVTTQKQLCNLPGYSMSERDFPGETVDAAQYRKYLGSYAERFGLDIQRGFRVKSIHRGDDMENVPWIVECENNSNEVFNFNASAVIVATGKHRVPQRDTSDKLLSRLQEAGIVAIHSTDMNDKETWTKACEAAKKSKLCIVGFGNSAADLCTAILKSTAGSGSSQDETTNNDNKAPTIHVAARTVPPVFPRRKGFLRVDTVGLLVRRLPYGIQEAVTRLLWWAISDSATCDRAFPAHLPRWQKVNGRVPVIDKHGQLAAAVASGSLVGHGPVETVSSSGLTFEDGHHGTSSSQQEGGASRVVPIDLVIMATGYKKVCIIGREDRLNGLYRCGFGNDRFLPLRSIGEEAETIAKEIAESLLRHH
jgi:ribulose 1,5-bisphosphate synthetase/thiazole synthase